jgi:hypothetical protein
MKTPANIVGLSRELIWGPHEYDESRFLEGIYFHSSVLIFRYSTTVLKAAKVVTKQ